jgi:hypothetical protein
LIDDSETSCSPSYPVDGVRLLHSAASPSRKGSTSDTIPGLPLTCRNQSISEFRANHRQYRSNPETAKRRLVPVGTIRRNSGRTVRCSFNEYIGPLSIQRFENCFRLIVARLRPEDSHSMPLLARFRGLQSPQVKAGTRAEVRVMTVMSSSWPNSCAVCAMISAGWTLRAAVRSKP